MDKKTEYDYFIILLIMMIMASTHNLLKSVLLYRTNVSRISSIIKIILNASGLACGISNIVALLTTISLTSSSNCLTATYLQMISNFAFSELVNIFLIWNLRQFGRSKKDDIIGYGLLLIRSAFYITYIALSHVSPICDDGKVDQGEIFLFAAIMTDFLINVYIAIRFFQYVKSDLKSSQDEQYTSKFIIWNALRISMTSIHVNFTTSSLPTVGYVVQTIFFIFLSYIITFDVEKLNNFQSDKGTNTTSTGDISGASISNILLRASNGIFMGMEHDVEKLEQNDRSLSFYSMIFKKENADKSQSLV